MRRSICYCEPKYAFAGRSGTWNFIYTPSNALPKGTRLKFDLLTKGREIDWQLPQTNMKSKSNLIWMTLPDGKTLGAEKIATQSAVNPHFEFILPLDIKSGENITISMGCPDSKDHEKNGTRAQTYVQRRRTFYLHIDLKGKGDYREFETFHLDIRGNDLTSIRVVTPSMVNKNERFDVIVRFEDAYGNLTNKAPEDTLVELSYEQLRENISWKLFVPETGFIALPNLYFNETGIYKIKLKNLTSGDEFLSPPIKCLSDHPKSMYWGTFHGEMELFDASENIETCLRHIRDDKTYQFYGVSPFESEKETPNEIWKLISNQIAEFNEEERFSNFLGFQWAGTPEKEGVRQIIYLKDNKPILQKKDSKYNSLKKIYKSHTPKEILSIPSFTMAKGVESNFSSFNPELEKVVEIYNAWGSSECLKKEGNPRPISSKSKKGYQECGKGSIREALNQNHRFGFVAGGYDDRGIYEGLYDSDQVQYTPGMTAIIATSHTRDALIQALHKHSCFATTGERMLIGIELAQQPMGSQLSSHAKPGLLYSRHLTGYAIGTSNLTEVTLFRNGEVFKTFEPEGDTLEFAIDDTDLLEKIALKSPDSRPRFTYYYLRAIQEDGHIAWASPIWVDLVIEKTPVTANRKKTKKD